MTKYLLHAHNPFHAPRVSWVVVEGVYLIANNNNLISIIHRYNNFTHIIIIYNFIQKGKLIK